MGAWLAELFIALAAGKWEQFKKLRKFCAWAIPGGWVVYLDTCKDKFQAIQNICLVLKMLIVLEITWYRDLILTERESLVLPCLSLALFSVGLGNCFLIYPLQILAYVSPLLPLLSQPCSYSLRRWLHSWQDLLEMERKWQFEVPVVSFLWTDG